MDLNTGSLGLIVVAVVNDTAGFLMPGSDVSGCGTIGEYVGIVGLAALLHAETDVFDQLRMSRVR